MSGLPTLGGIKALQKFLKANDVDLPLFQIESYSNEALINARKNTNLEPTKIITVPLLRYLRIDGEKHHVLDRRISSKDGLQYIRFRDPVKCGFENKIDVILKKIECWVEYSPNLNSFVNRNKFLIKEILKK
jgi:hypothetical protein